ncbi:MULTISPECIES: PilZ domain-containing protein [Lysobacteraceae]|jgi:c-di-GMP-binding flagellar brake protein YcgR|uniref:C-di-GMP-binding flagellar brake protein YcgR n=1 Tax=Agrilutibacter niabensis TaxID=380628 RepID=A0ABU1VMN2_9GAMM|nr:PilZ domain-containing protein [Lysobacter niabensis]MDR7098737.1 c-di-GMP-binding flagellar brake protein YcgR [Lysobacter niabensis]
MNAIAPSERRDGDRVPYASRVMIVRGESAWFAQLLDLSEGGCGVFRPDGCELREDEVVRLFFYQDTETSAVIVPARVARIDGVRIGIEYHEPQAIPPR